ncbi:MAG TPA: pyridoxamine 5'-phosphate oxidase family protein [Paucimonas sp.]|nr:pyridoxamine 5'-phosphate oxidase family protein [Paucimonas sp.]
MADSLAFGAKIGILGIDPATRRRNRLNGRISAMTERSFEIAVAQSFGNCSQYIQRREYRWLGSAPAGRVHIHEHLDEAARALVRAADTFFIASACVAAAGEERHQGVDVSHRGGRPGFVMVDGDTIVFPDFSGNAHYRTLGNLQVDRRAGLLFMDFTNRDLLYLAVETEIIWESELIRAFPGAQLLVRCYVRQAIRIEAALPFVFSEPEYSPQLTTTGTWSEAGPGRWHRFRITRAEHESALVRSLYLEPASGTLQTCHLPGQFLTLRLPLPDGPTVRAYTISDAPGGSAYRISVKHQGRASGWLHAAPLGVEIEVQSPRGDFVLDCQSERPIVFVSAGIGITPMLAMLNSLCDGDGRIAYPQPVHFIHATRNGSEHCFRNHLLALAERNPKLCLHVFYDQQLPGDRLGVHFHSAGRMDIGRLRKLLPPEDFDFYLCGPVAWMQAMYDGLREMGVADSRIHSEPFGPASVRRLPSEPTTPISEQPVQINFSKSGRTGLWSPVSGTILEFAEALGLTPHYGCRSGVCGECASHIRSGSVTYAVPPVVPLLPARPSFVAPGRH